MTYTQQDGARDSQPDRAALFVDYENLFRTLGRSAERYASPADLISEMIEALQRSLLEDRQTQCALTRAYADFASLEDAGERVQRSLYLQGVEPHFVPRAITGDAVETQLCVDAMDMLHYRADISTFVLLTGRRAYLPLIRILKRYGRNVLVLGLDEPATLEEVPHQEGGWYFPAQDLLSAASRGSMALNDGRRTEPAGDLQAIEDPILVQTLEIIDEYFGQYEEVYLTPLLRKLSELLDERRCDPKHLISDLEDQGAVRLEKRQGFPHDYTVLILEAHHPSVRLILTDKRPYGAYDDDLPESGAESTRLDGEVDGAYRQNGQANYMHDGYGAHLDGEPMIPDDSDSSDSPDASA